MGCSWTMRKDRKAEGSDERRAAETGISGMTKKTERTGKWTDMPEETERGQFAERPETAGRNDRIEKKMSRTGYVFCGGDISDALLPLVLRRISLEKGNSERKPYVIAADRGLVCLDGCGVEPDLVVGDFDSAPSGFIDDYRTRHPKAEIRSYSPEKDFTDSEIGARAAVDAGCSKIVMIGATGSRLDHVLGNLQVLDYLMEAGVWGEILDLCNRITIHGGARGGQFSIRKEEQWGKYVSLFAFGGDVEGLTLTGFHYNVKNFRLSSVGSRAVSNEIDACEGTISFRKGKLLVIESRDTPAGRL
ncbi:MAG TPA: thiamine diphosphokinase [Lachnospiraceae bacterium]|nr:thiamine diphosphokinase [Lachnospiraceae bacterium]HCG60141.1 thiamine diphosphokinase [Lachnospiraceae bacterium]